MKKGKKSTGGYTAVDSRGNKGSLAKGDNPYGSKAGDPTARKGGHNAKK